MRIAHVGNLGNTGYNAVKYLRKAGYDAELVLPTASTSMESPAWRGEEKPDWVRDWPLGSSAPGKLRGAFRLYSMLRGYDVVHAHCKAAIYAQFYGKPFVAHAMGSDLRTFSFENSLEARLMRRAFTHATKLFFSSPDLSEPVKKLKISNAFFIPLVIDDEYFRPSRQARFPGLPEGAFVVFHPTGHHWWKKGNDLLIRAFARFSKRHKDAFLVMAKWGSDFGKSESLVRSLGLSGRVLFIDPVPTRELVRYYGAADVVVDQFVVEAIGYVGLEALSCGKTVIAGVVQDRYELFYGERAPLLNVDPLLSKAKQEDALVGHLESARDAKLRSSMGSSGREWILKYHAWKPFAKRLMYHYETMA